MSDIRVFSLDLAPPPVVCETKKEQLSFEMPIGLYTDAYYENRYGIVLENGRMLNDIFAPERINAYIFWVDRGYAEYEFPCSFFKEKRVTELYFTLEICAEAPQYRNDWKSDITFSVNGKELGTYTSPSDFGGKRGKLNPAWWSDDFTQYGQLVKVAVTKHGSYINGMRVSDVTLDKLGMNDTAKCTFRVENKRSADNAGGFNLFSKRFGDYEQDIIMTAVCETEI